MKKLLLLMLLTAQNASAAGGGFLFVTFKGEQSPMTEQIYFALSRDGRQWQALHGGDPVLVSTLGEKGVRDPFLLRSHEGNKFYLLATDLSINRNHDWSRAVRAGSKSLVIWESDDLTHWSEPRLVPVAAADAGCAWAPEAVYDEESGNYLVFWASTPRATILPNSASGRHGPRTSARSASRSSTSKNRRRSSTPTSSAPTASTSAV
jgi:arabinoxylan arabinofuranohydrolase